MEEVRQKESFLFYAGAYIYRVVDTPPSAAPRPRYRTQIYPIWGVYYLIYPVYIR